ncbi:MAG: Uma2 family endonuclease [Armatimonadota bacterium]
MPRTVAQPKAQTKAPARRRKKGAEIPPEHLQELEEIIREAESIELLEEDGEPLESEWHVLQIPLLIEVVRQHLGDPSQYYCAGNMFVYYSMEQAEAVKTAPHTTYKGPDFFVVRGVDGRPLRRYWVAWREGGRYPDLVVELVSPSTAKKDKEENLRFYAEVMHVPEYFWYDPDKDELRGFYLVGGRYEPITPNEHGWLWSQILEAYIGVWDGEYQDRRARWVRLYRADGTLVPTNWEIAEQERQRAEQERQRAEQERQRAEQAEAELNRLREQLRERGIEL